MMMGESQQAQVDINIQAPKDNRHVTGPVGQCWVESYNKSRRVMARIGQWHTSKENDSN